MHPTPSTLNTQHSTLHPQHSTLNTQPYTLNPQPSTLHPTPYTPDPKPSTRCGAACSAWRSCFGAASSCTCSSLRRSSRGTSSERTRAPSGNPAAVRNKSYLYSINNITFWQRNLLHDWVLLVIVKCLCSNFRLERATSARAPPRGGFRGVRPREGRAPPPVTQRNDF